MTTWTGLGAFAAFGMTIVGVGGCMAAPDAVPYAVEGEAAALAPLPNGAAIVSIESTQGEVFVPARKQFETAHFADIRGLLAAWREVAPFEGALRFVLVDSSRLDHGVVQEVYGATASADALTLATRLTQIAPSDDDALWRFLEQVRCRFPGLGRTAALHYPSLVLRAPRTEAIAWLKEALRKVGDETVAANEVARVFGYSGATTYASEGSHCATIVFGRKVESGVVQAEARDTVLHEVGHVLDLSSRPVNLKQSTFAPRALGEALADTMSHAYSGSPCHVPLAAVPGGLVGEGGGCLRRLDTPPDPLSKSTDPYAFGQSARVASWAHMLGKPIAIRGRTLLRARDKVESTKRSFQTDIIFGRKPTAEEKKVLESIEADALTEFLAALAP
jgi:hypothetical protein